MLHGVIRFTADLDLMVSLDNNNIKKLLEAMKILGYKPRLPVDPEDFSKPEIRQDWINNKNMKVFSFAHTKDDHKSIDIFTHEPIPFEEAWQRKQIAKTKDVSINIISFKDLIALKKISAREQDLNDIKMLEELGKKYGHK